jgi:hypothetical protein
MGPTQLDASGQNSESEKPTHVETEHAAVTYHEKNAFQAHADESGEGQDAKVYTI